jgi:hypothetical protein
MPAANKAAPQRPSAATTSLPAGNQGGPQRANFQASSRTHCLQPRASKPLFGVVVWQDGRSPSTWPGVLLLRVASMRFSYRSSSVVFLVRAARSVPSSALISKSGIGWKRIVCGSAPVLDVR